jgi:two-component system, NarL family, sensor histidine kinase UhpB
MKNPIKILMLEDSTEDTEIIQRLLSREMAHLQFELATSREEFLLALDRFTPSIVLADNSLFHFNARQALDIIQQRALGIPFIMVTGTISEEFAADIIKSGADDYILKDRLNRLPTAILAAMAKKRGEIERQAAIREMEVLSLIAKETSSSVMIFDKTTGNISWVNEGFIRNTGYSLQESRGRAPWGLLGGAKTDKNSTGMIDSYIQNDSSFSCDLLIYTSKGKPKWQFMSGQAIRNEKGIGTAYFIIATDISERKIMEEERITGKIERQREVARVILQSQEIERNALGRELHDNISQLLAAINLQLCYYQNNPENNIDQIEKCRTMLTQAIKEARDLSHGMVMPRFSQNSLKDELELLFGCFTSSTKVYLDLEKMNELTIPIAIKETIYRIAQVQLHNIGKYSKANEVQMRVTNDREGVEIMICDNGVGFDTTQKRNGIGITNIYARVESYNGTANIISKPGEGCILSVSLPVAEGKTKRQKRSCSF